jgi:hypothetical protein
MIFGGILIGLALWFGIFRNNLVYKERIRVIKVIYDSVGWEWRQLVLQQISYNDMLISLRPVRSFFKDHPCIIADTEAEARMMGWNPPEEKYEEETISN